jgi:hypothetical protein
MSVTYDVDTGELTVHGNIEQSSVQRILGMLGLFDIHKQKVWIDRIVLSGNVSLYLDSLTDLDIRNTLTLVLSQKSTFTLNVEPNLVLGEFILLMSGASECYVYNDVKHALISLTGRTECIFQKPIHSFVVERLGFAAKLQICGEKIVRMMKRVWDESTLTFMDDFFNIPKVAAKPPTQPEDILTKPIKTKKKKKVRNTVSVTLRNSVTSTIKPRSPSPEVRR